MLFDLEAKKTTVTYSVGSDPDVLAFDKTFGRLYVSAESEVISIFDEYGRSLEKIGEGFFAANAHTVAVDSRTHRVYFPLRTFAESRFLESPCPLISSYDVHRLVPNRMFLLFHPDLVVVKIVISIFDLHFHRRAN